MHVHYLVTEARTAVCFANPASAFQSLVHACYRYLECASVCFELFEEIIEGFRGGWVQPHIRSVGAACPTPGD